MWKQQLRPWLPFALAVMGLALTFELRSWSSGGLEPAEAELGSAPGMGVAASPDPEEQRELSPMVAAARRMVQTGRLSQAVMLLNAVITVAPEDVEARYWRGRALAEDGQHSEAITDLAQAVALDPFHVDAHEVLARSLMAERRYEEAMASLDKAVSMHPDAPANWSLRARARMLSNDFPGALFDAGHGCELGDVESCEAVSHIQRRIRWEKQLARKLGGGKDAVASAEEEK
jgi:tetratricopeptide (TPR) repeat protein